VIRSRLRALASASRLGRFLSVGVVGLVFDVTTATVLRDFGEDTEFAKRGRGRHIEDEADDADGEEATEPTSRGERLEP
jgi:hypothetical protein